MRSLVSDSDRDVMLPARNVDGCATSTDDSRSQRGINLPPLGMALPIARVVPAGGPRECPEKLAEFPSVSVLRRSRVVVLIAALIWGRVRRYAAHDSESSRRALVRSRPERLHLI